MALNLEDAQSSADQQQTAPATPNPAPGKQDPANATTPAKGDAGAPPAANTPNTGTASSTQGQGQTSEGQLKQEEHQRVFGVMATFNTTRNHDALPLTPKEKYQLFFKSATDPWPFGLAAFIAGLDQAQNNFPEYGQGMQGYAKRFGAEYTDYFTGNLLGNAVLASLLKEDPRYFQRGRGPYVVRFLWAATSTVWAKRDNGTWGPNYANVLGNLMGAAVSNLYYPQDDRTVGGTIGRGMSVTAQAIIGSEVIEFWPDIVRHHRRKQAEKQARQSLQNGSQTPTPVPAGGNPPPASPDSSTPAPPPHL